MNMTHAEIIDEVHATLLKEWSPKMLADFFLTGLRDDDTLNIYHSTLGTYIRNHYNLWEVPWEPMMQDYHGCLCDCSPYHPDAVSNTIINEVWKKGLPHGHQED